jgi:hypothetical protein
MNDIIFTLHPVLSRVSKRYYPVPASQDIPEWYKKMTTNYSDSKNLAESTRFQTIKRCMPVFDAITAGYILYTYSDIYIERGEDFNISYSWSNQEQMPDMITLHPDYQVKGYLNKEFPTGAPKYKNPWCIKTPKGYSILIVPPAHRESPIKILEGVVDSDKYTDAVQFPFIVKDEFEGLIPAGTPLAQIIPFKREVFKMQIGTDLEKAGQDAFEVRSSFFGSYRNHFRTKKEYK